MKNILVAISQPQDAEQLIAQAVKLARYANGKIWITHVTEPNPDDFLAREAGPQYKYDQKAKSRTKEANFIKQCAEEITKNNNIPAEGLLIVGTVPEAIQNKVEECNIDLVVTGHRKKDFLYGLFTANKKKDLVDVLNIPLLAVPLV